VTSLFKLTFKRVLVVLGLNATLKLIRPSSSSSSSNTQKGYVASRTAENQNRWDRPTQQMQYSFDYVPVIWMSRLMNC